MIIPLLVLFIIIYGIIKKVNVYDTFVDGAKEGVEMGLSLFPYILGMILATNILLKSGLLDAMLELLAPIFNFFHFPKELFPLAFIRSISGSASISTLNMILSTYGADSFIGKVASTMQGSTDTTIYIITLYFGSIGIKKTRHALKAGLFADLITIIASVIMVKLLL